jgi:hypothetical protein
VVFGGLPPETLPGRSGRRRPAAVGSPCLAEVLRVPSTSVDWPKKALVTCLQVVLALGLGLLVSEIALRLLGIPRFYDLHSPAHQFSDLEYVDGTVLWRNARSATIRFVYDGNPRGYFGDLNEVDHRTNSHGFRGGEFSVEKTPETVRIAFLGDSFTFGEGVRDEDTYAARTSALLNRQTGAPVANFESYNFGVGGFSLVHEFMTLTRVVLPLKPDFVVLKMDLPDFERSILQFDPREGTVYRDPRWYEEPTESIAAAPPDAPWFALNLSKLVWQILHRIRLSRRTIEYYNSLTDERNEGWVQNREALRNAIRVCRDRGLGCIVLCFPILHGLEDDDYPFATAHVLMREEVESQGVPFLDLLGPLRGSDSRDLWVHPTDRHPNEQVHELAARMVAEAILRNGVADRDALGSAEKP